MSMYKAHICNGSYINYSVGYEHLILVAVLTIQ